MASKLSELKKKHEKFLLWKKIKIKIWWSITITCLKLFFSHSYHLSISTLFHHECFLIFSSQYIYKCVIEFEMGMKVYEFYWADRKDEELRATEMSFIIHKIINLWRLHSICDDDITWLCMMNFLLYSKLNLKLCCKMCIGLGSFEIVTQLNNATKQSKKNLYTLFLL